MMLRGVEQALREAGYELVTCFLPEEEREIKTMEEVMCRQGYPLWVWVAAPDGSKTLWVKRRTSQYDSKYRQAIIRRLDQQTKKGLAKYGRLLDDNKLDVVTRLSYLAEELIDGLQYIEWLQDGLGDCIDALIDITADVSIAASKVADTEYREQLLKIGNRLRCLIGKLHQAYGLKEECADGEGDES